MAFYGKSFLKEPTYNCNNHDGTEHCSSNVALSFFGNKARKRGGALFVEDSDYNTLWHSDLYGYDVYCLPFYCQVTEQIAMTVKFIFSQNAAKLAGNDVFGGWIDFYQLLSNFDLTLIFTDYIEHQVIASNPIRICVCLNSAPVCNITESFFSIFPGQSFEIKAVAVGQRIGIVPSIVVVESETENLSLGKGQEVQSVERDCSLLTFSIYSDARVAVLNLKAHTVDSHGPNVEYLSAWLPERYKILSNQYSIGVTLKDCPIGFILKTNRCLCVPLLQFHKGVGCDYDTFKVIRDRHTWISVITKDNNTHTQKGIVIHDHCPYTYCRTDNNSLLFRLEFPDSQCAFNHSGILCGECKENFSLVLGTSNCKECSKSMLFLVIVPCIVLAGIMLVGFLMFTNLTVSTGTISGLVFYANVIRATHTVYFPPEISTSFLSTFIAWLNLDLGIETCFYNGLNAYSKTWLQFAFPLYIWLMVITIIIASHYSSIAAKFTPNNALQVLATLFLFSYTKIIRTVITVFSSTVLDFPDGFKMRVWLYNGNVEFLSEKHVPLFTASLLLLVLLSVPYTLSLVSIQWLQRISHLSPLFWVHKFMPLFEAYTGPYKHSHRYWTGFLLLVRVIILIIYTFNQANNPAINLVAIGIISFALASYVSYMQVYKSQLCNILEITFLLNLGFLSLAALYDDNHEAWTTASVSVAFSVFMILIIYHGVCQLLTMKKVRDTKGRFVVAMTRWIKEKERAEDPGEREDKTIHVTGKAHEITHTSVELCSPLL